MNVKPETTSDELPIDLLRRCAAWIDYENETLLQQLPSVTAVVEYFELWSTFDTDLMSGIIEVIEHHGYDPAPLNEFIDKYDLPWCKYVGGQWIEPAAEPTP